MRALLGDVRLQRPATVEQLARAVAEAAAVREQVQVTGSGSMPRLRLDAGREVREISTLRMNKVIEHAVADMTVTVQAGMSLEALQRELAWRNQWLPLDPPALSPRVPGARTLGGLVATNSLGPLREIGAGTNDFRRLLLGITWIDAAGRILQAGGRTMKNAAGYQLQRLMTGACGTLGIVAEMTLRTSARPEDEAGVTFYCATAEAAAALAAEIRLAPVTPAYVQVVHSATFGGNPLGLPAGEGMCVIAGFLDRAAANRAQVEAVRLLPAAAGLESISHNAAQCGRLRLWMTSEPAVAEGAVAFRLHTMPALAAQRAWALGRRAGTWVVAEANAGVVRGHAPRRALEKVVQAGDVLVLPGEAAGGNALVAALKGALDAGHVFGTLG